MNKVLEGLNKEQERGGDAQGRAASDFNDEEKRNSKPKFIEEAFNFKLDDVKITGRFDRIDEEPDGAVIMDFKTSEIKTQKDADKRVKESKQLDLYSLAYQNIFAFLPKKVELYFLESGIIGSREVDEDHLEEVKEDIEIVSEGIRKQNFKATPAYMACRYCAYNQICPFVAVK